MVNECMKQRNKKKTKKSKSFLGLQKMAVVVLFFHLAWSIILYVFFLLLCNFRNNSLNCNAYIHSHWNVSWYIFGKNIGEYFMEKTISERRAGAYLSQLKWFLMGEPNRQA